MDTGGVIGILKSAGPPLWKYVQYYRKLNENMRILIRNLEELKSRKADIELRLATECRVGKLPKAEVNNWLKNTQRIYDEVQNIEQKIKEVKCLSRAHLGKLIEEKIQEVKEHYQKGSSSESLVIDAAPSRGLALPTTTLIGETTAKKNMDEVWEYLMGNEVMKIGVCGMGGCGKTTIIAHINNKLLKETNNFTNVIWITISQPLDLMKLQDNIATELHESLQNAEDKRKRAGEVLKMLQVRRFVLILDDMWEAFRLEDVGIPEPNKENGCKLVITTRSLDVCNFMGCKVINVKPLPEDEALELFLDQVGNIISQSPTLEEIVKLVVKQCAGLPLAIVTVAGCMKGVHDIREWRNALEELSQNVESVRGMETTIPRQSQFSYDRLKDKNIQHCFLCCALYPEDFEILKEELIGYWIAEGLVGQSNRLQAAYDKGHSIVNRLVNNCLLENVRYGQCVKMHDLIRDMALQITSQSPLFMVKAGLKLMEIPKEEEWNENLAKVSLMRSNISEIPSNLSPNCQALSTLLLQQNPIKNIAESFFLLMPNLRILDLSYTSIEVLPNSISELRCLTTLSLNHCKQLQHVPSLAKLSSLWKLELRETKIKEVPVGMEMLEKLRYLDLYSKELERIPVGILSKLFRLKKLSIFLELETSPTVIEDITTLSQLEIFEGHFCNLKNFNLYVSLASQCPTPQNYKLLLASRFWDLEGLERLYVNKHMVLLEYDICQGEDSVSVLEEVQRLKIGWCSDMTSLSDGLLFNKLFRDGRLSGKC